MKFRQAEAESWVGACIVLTGPFKNLPPGTRGTAKKVVLQKQEYHLEAEFRHPNLSGSNRHMILLTKRDLERVVECSNQPLSESTAYFIR